ncbi:ABC transporter ATP-binding protein [Vibrio sp. HN007]|uniref:ABC transporter ATP-binding protein n=1 Tax=Vibrio iocasae TaxID=3098914 RepID=UPI0035D45508
MDNNVVELTDLEMHFGDVKALKEINLTLPSGEVLGLFGHNGAGKTTMMKLILGVLNPTHGSISVMGSAPMSQSAAKIRQRIGYLPENVSFYQHLTGLEVLNFFARLKGVKKSVAIELLEELGLAHAMNRAVKTYSKGMKQRLGLAQATLTPPKLLILDEPTVGLDPVATQDFYVQVDKLKKEGCTVILCSHVLPGVEQHIDKAMILANGRTQAFGTLDELRSSAALPTHITAKGLNGALHANETLRPYLTGPDRLVVENEQKISVIRQLAAHPALEDMVITPPTLEQLYQFYMPAENNHPSVEEESQ